jgi:tRNA(Ile)-lysidine synthase
MTTTSDRDRLVAEVVRHVGDAAARVGVACSGGADSIALLDAAIRGLGAARVVAMIVDHGLSPGSAAVCAEVAAWARGQGAHAVVRAVQLAGRASIEAAARTARYAALGELARAEAVTCVLVGHTARDQAETVLHRVLRGTGPAGLVGIRRRRGVFVRPFLGLPRAEIEAYVQRHGLPVWRDPMNDDRRFARVRMREELMPALRRENPQLEAALVRLADSAAEWAEAIDARAARWGRFPIDVPALAAEPPAIRKRALALALDAAGIGYGAAHLVQLDGLLAGRGGEREIDLTGATIVRSYDVLTLGPAPVAERPAPPTPAAGFALRTWRAGDRMRPTRLKGRSRKLSDLYGDARVPRAARAAARVIVREHDGVIVWAEHLGAAHDAPCFEAPSDAREEGAREGHASPEASPIRR